MTNTLLLLAGGKSSRMKKSVNTEGMSQAEIQAANRKNKGMIEINNRPFMDYIMYNAQKAGIENIVILTGEENSDMKSYYGEKETANSFNGMNLSYAVQYVPEGREKPFGTADAVFQAMEQRKELQTQSFIVCNCDNLYSINGIKSLINLETPNGWLNYDRSGLEFPKEQIEAFAITSTDGDGYLLDIIEKPSSEEVGKFADQDGTVRVSMNIFKFDGNMLYSYVKNCPINPARNEKELPTAILNMVNENPKSMRGISIYEHVPDLTRKEDIVRMKKYLKNQQIDW